MGIDSILRFKETKNDESINDLAYRLAKQIGHDAFYEHPCISTSYDYEESGWYNVRLWSKYYGPGYERGNWPTLRGMLIFLDANTVGAEYGPDTSEFTRPVGEVIIENDAHWLEVGYPYHWEDWHTGTSIVDAPLDKYGKLMVQKGWGGNFALFRSAATGEELEYKNGVWTDRKAK